MPVFALKAIGALLGKRAEIERLTGTLHVNMEKTRQELNWEPRVSSEASFHTMGEWYLKSTS